MLGLHRVRVDERNMGALGFLRGLRVRTHWSVASYYCVVLLRRAVASCCCVVLLRRAVASLHWVSIVLLLSHPNCSQNSWGDDTTAASILFSSVAGSVFPASVLKIHSVLDLFVGGTENQDPPLELCLTGEGTWAIICIFVRHVLMFLNLPVCRDQTNLPFLNAHLSHVSSNREQQPKEMTHIKDNRRWGRARLKGQIFKQKGG